MTPLGFVVVTWRRCGANARTDRQRTERRSSPCRRNASGSAISATDRDKGRRHGQFLRFMGAMTVSDRLNAHPIRHAFAPLRPPRHNARPVMPIGLVALSVRRCRASARSVGLSTRLSPPSLQNAGGGAISATDSRKGEVTVNSCGSQTR